MEKQKSFKLGRMEKQVSFKHDGIERSQSVKFGAMEKQQGFKNRMLEKAQSFKNSLLEKQQSFKNGPLEKQQSFKNGQLEKQQSFKNGPLEKQQSFKNGPLEKQQSFKNLLMEKQKSFRTVAMEKQKSFRLGKIEKKRHSMGKRGETPLHVASRIGDLTQVQAILEGCEEEHLKELISKQNQDDETALYVAAENGHAEIVHEILKHCDIQSATLKARSSYDAFHIATRLGHLDVLRELLFFPDLAMTTSSLNSTALDTAVAQGHPEVVDLLLQTVPSLSKISRSNGKSVLHLAARKGNIEVVRSLLREDPSIGFKTDRKGQTGLHMAVKGPKENVEVVRELLKPDPSIISLEDNKGNTALHIATIKGRPQVVKELLLVEGIDVNSFNKVGETAFDIAVKTGYEVIATILRDAGGIPAKDHANPPGPVKRINKTVSDIKHDVESQMQQTRQTGRHVNKIKSKLKKLQIGGLNNTINSNTIVAVLIATVAFAAIFSLPAQNVETPTVGYELGQAYIANRPAFGIFFVFDSLSLFISLSVVVVQTSLIVTDQKAMTKMVFVINKLMWLACLFISVAFIALTFIVVGRSNLWLAWATTAIGAVIMVATIGSMCYCIVSHRIEKKNKNLIRRASRSQSQSWSVVIESDSELLNNEFKMFAL